MIVYSSLLFLLLFSFTSPQQFVLFSLHSLSSLQSPSSRPLCTTASKVYFCTLRPMHCFSFLLLTGCHYRTYLDCVNLFIHMTIPRCFIFRGYGNVASHFHLPAYLFIFNFTPPKQHIIYFNSSYSGPYIRSPCPVSYTHLDVYKRQV